MASDYLQLTLHYGYVIARLAPNVLKNLPIFSSRTSQIFTYYSFFIPIAPPIIPLLYYCVNDNITIQKCQYIIYIADYVY